MKRKFKVRSKEWPLIIFTLATQLAVGVFVLLWGLSPALGRVVDQPGADRLTGLLLLGIVVLLGFGVMSATLHLGNPINAYLALSNWRTSWLSREMLLGVLFGGLVSLFTALHWLGVNAGPIRLTLGGLASLAGLALVFGIGKLYMLRTVPAWNSPATPVTFFATAFLLGSLTLGAALAVAFPAAQVAGSLQFLALPALLAMVTQVVTFALHAARLGGQGGAAAISARRLGVEFGQIAAWRLALAGVGVGLFAACAFQVMPLPGLAVLACGLALLSEVMGRFLFYESYVRVGL
jgi:anaerobic dimethyl sulfoxide reductase subunit C (anchor subunit)